MHLIFRRYAGAADRATEAAQRAQAGLVPLLKAHQGFHGYVAFPSEQGDIVSCSIYADDTAAARSADQVRGWVQGNLKGIMPDTPTETFSGTVGMHAMVTPQSGKPAQSLYCLVRKSEGVPTDGSQRKNVEEMLTAAKNSPGFRGAYFVRSDDDPARGAAILFCDTREQGIVVHEETMAISRRNQPDIDLWVVASGKTAVLAMA
jgi:hypothetical protein